RCAVVRVGAADDPAFIGFDGGPGLRTGLQALLDVDEVSIVAAPGAATPAVQAAMIAHCAGAGDRMAILDPAAATDDVGDILAQRGTLASDDGFAALYFPWLEASPTGTTMTLPPSGFVAGVFSATEADASPVGVIATATGVAYPVTDAEQDQLNPEGINAIRDLSGIRIWGARTLATGPEWRYVAVRRMALCIEESIQEGTAWCLAQPNEPATWFALEGELEVFLHGLFLAGWFQGTTAEEAYFARCDATTMTAVDIAEGRTVMLAAFAPLVPAEFVVLRIVQQRADLSAVAGIRPGGPTLHPASPNPFNPRTTVGYELEAAGRMSLAIYDLSGRLVRTLLEGWCPAGPHSLSWDGTGSSGQAVASGTYLLHLETSVGGASAKLMLVR
ncbi:MAG: FlgD immunoglobulin-like domain containing protein, partial [Candidatus Krumholzibacteriia bacterium]